MKRLCSFLCLFVSLCILFPVFSISPSAAEVDGNTVYTYWYIDNVEDLQLFENTIVSLSNPYTFNINATIVLNEPIPSNTLFDLDIGLQFDSYADPSVEVQFVEPGYTVVGHALVDIVDDRIIINNLQFDYDITRLYLKFYVTYPTWTTVQTVYDFTIDGATYECEANQTWSAWCSSSYNTLGLYVDNGYIYQGDSLSGKILKTGNTSVLSSDLVDKDKSYYLEQLAVVPTTINFYIGSNQCSAEVDMTWNAWANSEYNTLSLIVEGTSLYTPDKSAILANNGIPVIATNKIIEGNTYTLSPYSVNPTIIFNGQTYEYEAGMTWGSWINSDYNVLGIYSSGALNPLLLADGSRLCYLKKTINYLTNEVTFSTISNYITPMILINASKVTDPNDENIVYFNFYGTQEYCDSIKNGDSNSIPTVSLFSRYKYEFDFSITSINVAIKDESGLLNGVIAWLKKISNDISGLANKIVTSISSKLEELFVPNDARILAIKEQFEQELRGRFGVLFDAVDIVDMVANTFVYEGTSDTIILPAVTVNLAGTPFTFGGYEVDVIPDGFEDLVDALRLVVNITCTWWFVLAMKKRLEEVLSK